MIYITVISATKGFNSEYKFSSLKKCVKEAQILFSAQKQLLMSQDVHLRERISCTTGDPYNAHTCEKSLFMQTLPQFFLQRFWLFFLNKNPSDPSSRTPKKERTFFCIFGTSLLDDRSNHIAMNNIVIEFLDPYDLVECLMLFDAFM